jgi:hypothetical protein
LKLEGKIYVKGKVVNSITVSTANEGLFFRDRLEKCLLDLCKELDIPTPLWLRKNTKELAIFKRTFFPDEQFMENVWFDRFEIIMDPE